MTTQDNIEQEAKVQDRYGQVLEFIADSSYEEIYRLTTQMIRMHGEGGIKMINRAIRDSKDKRTGIIASRRR